MPYLATNGAVLLETMNSGLSNSASFVYNGQNSPHAVLLIYNVLYYTHAELYQNSSNHFHSLFHS